LITSLFSLLIRPSRFSSVSSRSDAINLTIPYLASSTSKRRWPLTISFIFRPLFHYSCLIGYSYGSRNTAGLHPQLMRRRFVAGGPSLQSSTTTAPFVLNDLQILLVGGNPPNGGL